MRLSFDPNPSSNYPHGYWYAASDDGWYDADGATVEDAVTTLCLALEKATREFRSAATSSATEPQREGS